MCMARIDLIILIPKWVLMGIICILYILIPYPLTVEEYQGGKSPLDSVTCKSGKKLVKLRYHKDIFLACKWQGSI